MRRHFAKRHCAGLLIAKSTTGFTTAARTLATDRTDTTVTEPTSATSSVEEARKRWQKRLKELKHEQQQQVAKNKDDVTVLSSSTEPTSSAAADRDDDVALMSSAHSAVAHQERVMGLHFGKKLRVVRAAETIALHRQWYTACVEGEQLLKKLLAPMEKELRRLEERLETSSSSRKQMMLRPKDVLSIRRTFLDVQAQLHTSIELNVQTNASDKNNKSSSSNGGATTSSSSPKVQQTLRTALSAQRFAQLKRDVNHLVQQLSSSQQQGDENPQQNRQAAAQPFFLLRSAVQDVLVPQVKRLEDLQYRLLMRKYPVAVSKLERALTDYSKNTARRKVLHKNSVNEQGAQSHHQLAVAPLTFVQNGRVLRSLMVMERQREQFMEKILASYDDRIRAAKRREMKWERTVAYYEEKKRRLLKAIRPQMATPREMATLEHSMKEIDFELEKAREALLGEEASGTLAKHVAAELREIETDRQLLLVQPVAKPYVSVRMWTLLEESLDVVAAPYLPAIVPPTTSTMELDRVNVDNMAMLSQNAGGSTTTTTTTTVTKSIPASGSELATVEDGTSALSTWDADGTIANTTPRAPSPAATASPAARRLFIQCSYAIVDLLLVLQRHQHGIASFNSDVKQKKENGRKMDDDDGEEDQEDPSVLLNAVDTGIFERYPRQITTTTTASSTKHNKKKRKKNKKEDGDAKKATQSSSAAEKKNDNKVSNTATVAAAEPDADLLSAMMMDDSHVAPSPTTTTPVAGGSGEERNTALATTTTSTNEVSTSTDGDTSLTMTAKKKLAGGFATKLSAQQRFVLAQEKALHTLSNTMVPLLENHLFRDLQTTTPNGGGGGRKYFVSDATSLLTTLKLMECMQRAGGAASMMLPQPAIDPEEVHAMSPMQRKANMATLRTVDHLRSVEGQLVALLPGCYDTTKTLPHLTGGEMPGITNDDEGANSPSSMKGTPSMSPTQAAKMLSYFVQFKHIITASTARQKGDALVMRSAGGGGGTHSIRSEHIVKLLSPVLLPSLGSKTAKIIKKLSEEKARVMKRTSGAGRTGTGMEERNATHKEVRNIAVLSRIHALQEQSARALDGLSAEELLACYQLVGTTSTTMTAAHQQQQRDAGRRRNMNNKSGGQRQQQQKSSLGFAGMSATPTATLATRGGPASATAISSGSSSDDANSPAFYNPLLKLLAESIIERYYQAYRQEKNAKKNAATSATSNQEEGDPEEDSISVLRSQRLRNVEKSLVKMQKEQEHHLVDTNNNSSRSRDGGNVDNEPLPNKSVVPLSTSATLCAVAVGAKYCSAKFQHQLLAEMADGFLASARRQRQLQQQQQHRRLKRSSNDVVSIGLLAMCGEVLLEAHQQAMLSEELHNGGDAGLKKQKYANRGGSGGSGTNGSKAMLETVAVAATALQHCVACHPTIVNSGGASSSNSSRHQRSAQDNMNNKGIYADITALKSLKETLGMLELLDVELQQAVDRALSVSRAMTKRVMQ